MEDKKTKKGVKKILRNLKEKIDKKLKEKCDGGSCCCKNEKENKC